MPGVCSRCLREVYFAEEKLALGKVWHTFCFSCRNCRKLLDSWTVETHSGELFCRNCYNRLFSTTSVRPSLPVPTIPYLPPVDNKIFSVSPCESLSDCRCCCCDEKCFATDAVVDPSNENPEPIVGISNCPLEKNRLRGGGGCKEDLDAKCSDLEVNDDIHSCGKDLEQLDLRTSPITICDQTFGPPAVTAWYNRQQSASQSTFSRPSSANQNPVRPSSTPVSGEAVDICNTCNLHCAASRRPGSPCRTNHKHCEHSRQCHRHRCHDLRTSGRVATSFQERRDSVEDCRGRNFAQNYRDHLRSKSPGARTAGGGGCSPLTDYQRQDEIAFDSYGQQKVPAGCECLGGGQDCQRCGRKVYQAEMMIASGVPYHNICFSCFCCRKPLETLTYHENCGEIYCKQCYVRNFGPQGYGYSGVLQTPM